MINFSIAPGRRGPPGRRVARFLLAAGLGAFGPGAGAEVRITQIVVDGQVQGPPVSSADAARAPPPVRLAASAQAIQFFFTESDQQGRPTARLRFRLEGYDGTWRDLPTRMRASVRFRDNDHQVVGGTDFYVEGESPGWRGTVEESEFVNRRETVAAPERSSSARISFLTHGGEAGMGLVAIDAPRVLVARPEDTSPTIFDLSVTGGSDLGYAWGTPDNWVREGGSRADLARLRTRPAPTPHPILILHDDDPTQYGSWATRSEPGIPIRAGERLTFEWQSAYSIGRSGPGQADYPRLRPGRYWFRVMAVKANGDPTGQEVSLPIEVVAPLYQRWEFWLVVVTLAGGAALWLRQILLHRRMLRRLAEIEHEQALERERARIARDLHDDIGAGLTEIAMQSDWVRRDIAANASVSTLRRIERVCQSAVELTRSVDEIVWAVNPANDALDRFANYLSLTTQQFLDAAGLRVRFDIPLDLPSTLLPGKVRHALFQGVREALNNVTKHARADLVRLELKVDERGLGIAIADDGCGFAPELARTAGTHEGLEGMRRRMEEIGGQFHVTSSPNGGTRVEFLAPLGT